MKHWIKFAVLFLISLLIFGCGGGGGKGVDNRAPGAPNVTTFKVPASTAVTKNVGGIVIEIPKAAFPAGADITVSQAAPSEVPPNEEFKPTDQGEVEISASAAPQAPIVLSVGMSNRVQSFSANQEIYLWLTQTNSGWAIKNTGSTAQIIIDAGQFVQNGAGSKVKGLMGKIQISEITNQSSLLPVGGSDSQAPKKTILLIVHGFNSRAEAFLPLGQFLAQKHRYERIYSYQYDWRGDCANLASALGAKIAQLTSDGSRLDILAHSMGAVISRYALEKLGKTKNVDNLFAVCGASTGSILASAGDLLLQLQNAYINLPAGAHQLFGFPTVEVPSLGDMAQGSAFLRTLNTSTMMQRGLVDYCFIGTNRDEIVGQKSGTAENIPLESFTAGRVYRHTESGDHSSLVNNEGGWQTLQQYMVKDPRSDGKVGIELDPNPVDAVWDGWYFSLMITNHGDQEIQLLDLSLDAYDRDGKWFDLEWYDPGTAPGVFFPNDHVTLNFGIAPGENYSCNLQECFNYDRDSIDNVPANLKARVLFFTLRYQIQGVTKLVTTQLVCQSTGILPAGPSIRSLEIHSGPNRQGKGRGATMRVK